MCSSATSACSAYDFKGNERWSLPLGPFNNPNGHGSSPILVDDLLILLCDQDSGSYLLAVDKETGRVRWKTDRPECDALILHSRSCETERTVRLRSWCRVPIRLLPTMRERARSCGRSTDFRGSRSQRRLSMEISCTRIGGRTAAKPSSPSETPILCGRRLRASIRTKIAKSLAKNSRPILDCKEASLITISPATALSMSATGVSTLRDGHRAMLCWPSVPVARSSGACKSSLPNAPSPLLYKGVLYLIKDGGILTAVDAKTGEILKQGRLPGAIDTYYASPVAGAGHVYLLSKGAER